MNAIYRGPLVRYEFDFDPANKIARCRVSGAVDDDDFRDFYADAGKFVDMTNPGSGLVDFSGVTSFEVSANTIRDVAGQPPALPGPNGPRVIVAPVPIIFGMMRMFEMVGEQTRPGFHVVHTEREAFAILGVLEPQFRPFAG